MSLNGAGIYTLPAGNPVVTGTTISTVWANNTLSDISSALSNAVYKDGQSTLTANIKMSTFKFTGLGAGTVIGDSLRFEQLFSQGSPVALASAATVDIGAQNSVAVEISGTTTITSLGTNYNGPRYLRFTGALVLTQSASLNLPGAANITTAAGDTAIAYPNQGATGWNVVSYTKAAAIIGTPEYVLVASATASASATIDFTGLSGANDDYKVVLRNVIPATDDSVLYMRFSQAAAFKTDALYSYCGFTTNSAAATGTVAAGGTTQMQLTGGVSATTADGGVNGSVEVASASGTAFYKSFVGDLQYFRSVSAASNHINTGGAYRGSTAAVDGIRLYMSAGNITSGTVLLYKRNKS